MSFPGSISGGDFSKNVDLLDLEIHNEKQNNLTLKQLMLSVINENARNAELRESLQSLTKLVGITNLMAKQVEVEAEFNTILDDFENIEKPPESDLTTPKNHCVIN